MTTKIIQIGDVFGEVTSVELQAEQTFIDALQIAGLSVGDTQQLIENSSSQVVNLNDVPTENEVYLITTNQTSG